MEIVFLNDLSKEYESSHQLLEFHAKTLDQMIETLLIAEAWMKGENEASYDINLVTESTRRLKAEWMKTVKYYNCDEIRHILKYCKKLKKAWKDDENGDFNDKKTKDKKIK